MLSEVNKNWFEIKDPNLKIEALRVAAKQSDGFLKESRIHLSTGFSFAGFGHIALDSVPAAPGREVAVLPIHELRKKAGFSTAQGQAQLIHDIANIELQAMELAMRTWVEYPQAPELFLNELIDIALSEARHLELCLETLKFLGFEWGNFPVHLSLWNSVLTGEDLCDRVLIVHRYLEGSGLDAGAQILKKLTGVSAPKVKNTVSIIAEEEIDHVKFGSRWFDELCKSQGWDRSQEFQDRLTRVFPRIPRRREKVNEELRYRAGFTVPEVEFLKNLFKHSTEVSSK